MKYYVFSAIGTIASVALFLFLYYFLLKRKARGLGYFRKKVIVTQFKPLKELSFKHYIALLPDAPKTATMAMLVELDREGKINIDGTDIEVISRLDACELLFIEAVKKERASVNNLLLKNEDVKIYDPINTIRNDVWIRKYLVENQLMFSTERLLKFPHPFLFLGLSLFVSIVVTYFFRQHMIYDSNGVLLLFITLFSVLPLAAVAVRRVKQKFYYLRSYTPEGIQVLDYYEGLKRYLKHAEKDRLLYFQDKNESEFLEMTPYLILFGMEGPWTNKLKKYRFVFEGVNKTTHLKF